MERLIEKELAQWKEDRFRKPLIIRGARQVGKTYSISEFGRKCFNNVARFDFEADNRLRKIFEGELTPEKLLLQLEAYGGQRISAGETLLFFDEAQACPGAIKSLRYFYEQMPSLHLVCAGSLMEFALGEHSFPVGSVEFKWMRPLCLAEFLKAVTNEILVGKLPSIGTKEPLLESIHEKLLEMLRLYFIIGGMPEAVERYRQTKSINEVARVHDLLVQSYLQDLNKYKGRLEIEGIDILLEKLPAQTGKQIKYSNIAPDWRTEKTKKLLHLLERILLIQSVNATSAQGLPLGAGTTGKSFKYVFLDIGLMQHMCGINANDIMEEKDLLDIYRGALAEQFVGQGLLFYGGSENGKLYFWSRNKKSSSAEVDYLKVLDNTIIPIEVKSGPAGRLKSLNLFLAEHSHCPFGLVLYCGNTRYDPGCKSFFMPLYTRLSKTS